MSMANGSFFDKSKYFTVFWYFYFYKSYL